jgi:hypothetical protein
LIPVQRGQRVAETLGVAIDDATPRSAFVAKW